MTETQQRLSAADALRQVAALPWAYPQAEDNWQEREDVSAGFRHQWETIRRKKAMVIVSTIVGIVAGLLISIPQTPIYRAKALVEIEGFNDNFLDFQDLAPTRANNSFLTDLETQVEVLQSRVVMEKVVDTLKLDQRPEFGYRPDRLSSWKRALHLPTEDLSPRERALEIAFENLDVESSRNSRIVEIVSDWPDPQLAADFANAIVETYIEHSMQARWDSTQRTAEWLSLQLEELRIKLEKSAEKLQQYAQANGLLFTSAQDSVEDEKLRQLQAELSNAQADRIKKQSKYELAAASPTESLPEVLDSQSLRQYQAKLTDLRRQMAELSATFTPLHPKVKRTVAQVKELEGVVGKSRANIVGRISNEYDASLRREKLLKVDYARQSHLVSQQANKSIQYNILKGEVDTNRELHDSLLQKVKEASVASAIGASNIRLVDPAKRPRTPYRPKHWLNATIGLLFGAMMGVVVVFVTEKNDRTLRQPGDSIDYLGVPELGVIPSIEAAEGSRSGRKRKSTRTLSRTPLSTANGLGLLGQGRDLNGFADHSVELVAWHEKFSVMTEGFRSTLTSILFSGGNGSRPQVLLITSPNPHEGKTTVVSNLAVSLAEMGQRVLLVDADMRRPRLHKVFGLERSPGIGELMGNDRLIGPISLLASVRKTQIPNLNVLLSGSAAGNLAGLFHSARMDELLRHARKHYHTVLIDTPPATHISDARVLAKRCDGVVLVVRAGVTTREAARAVAERFVGDGTRLLGTVLNSWNPKVNGSGYYGTYRYKDYYDYHSQESADQTSG